MNDTLTPDRVRAELAGRWLNTWVAVHVMGERYCGVCSLGHPNCAGQFVRPDGSRHCLPDYSHDIAAAWVVVPKFKPAEFVLARGKKGWMVVIGTKGVPFAKATSAPLALCRAAILAVLES